MEFHLSRVFTLIHSIFFDQVSQTFRQLIDTVEELQYILDLYTYGYVERPIGGTCPAREVPLHIRHNKLRQRVQRAWNNAICWEPILQHEDLQDLTTAYRYPETIPYFGNVIVARTSSVTTPDHLERTLKSIAFANEVGHLPEELRKDKGDEEHEDGTEDEMPSVIAFWSYKFPDFYDYAADVSQNLLVLLTAISSLDGTELGNSLLPLTIEAETIR